MKQTHRYREQTSGEKERERAGDEGRGAVLYRVFIKHV